MKDNTSAAPIAERANRSAGRIILYAAIGPVAMAMALGISIAVGPWVPGSGWLGRALRAAPTCLIAVAILLAIHRRRSGRMLCLTTPWRATTTFLTGIAVTTACATVVLGLGTAVGWLQWDSVDPPRLATFVLGNAVVALLLEAIPEELTLRGHSWTILRNRFSAPASVVGDVVMFLVTPVLASVVACAITSLIGDDPVPITFAPTGQDPVSYFILLTVFGTTLIAARTSMNSIWTGVGTHLAFLTIGRISIAGAQRHSGWSAQLTTPDAQLLVPAFLILTTLCYLILRGLRLRRIPLSHQQSAADPAEPSSTNSQSGSQPNTAQSTEPRPLGPEPATPLPRSTTDTDR